MRMKITRNLHDIKIVYETNLNNDSSSGMNSKCDRYLESFYGRRFCCENPERPVREK
jgi:hypothetical protein